MGVVSRQSSWTPEGSVWETLRETTRLLPILWSSWEFQSTGSGVWTYWKILAFLAESSFPYRRDKLVEVRKDQANLSSTKTQNSPQHLALGLNCRIAKLWVQRGVACWVLHGHKASGDQGTVWGKSSRTGLWGERRVTGASTLKGTSGQRGFPMFSLATKFTN